MAIPALPASPAAVSAAPAVTESTTAAPETTVEGSPERLALAKRERAHREKERSLIAREAKLKEQEERYKTDYIPKSRLKEDPLSLFKDNSLNYDQLVEQMMLEDNPVAKNAQQVSSALQARIDQLEAKMAAQETAPAEQTKKMIVNDVKVFLDGKTEYEALMAYGPEEAANAVSQFIIDHYDTTGFLMSEAEAAQKIDDNWTEEGLKFARLKKVQERLAAAGVDPAVAAQAVEAAKGSKWSSNNDISVRSAPTQQQAHREQVSLRTLTQTASPSVPATKKLTAAERYQRAIQIARGELKG